MEHLKASMLGGRVMTDVDQHSLLLWSLMFFTLENCEPDILDSELSEALTQVAVTTVLPALQPCPGLRSPGARASPLLVASTCLVRLLIHLEQSRPLQPQLEAAVCPPERGSCITPGTLLTTPCCQGGASS